MTGCDIVLSKWIGLKGTALIAEERSEELSREFSGYFINTARDLGKYLDVERETALAEGSGALYMRETGEGGIYKALWDMGEDLETGLEVELKAIPVKQETIEIANHFDIDPYKLLSGGSLLMVASRGYDLVRLFRKNGINAAVIGSVNNSKDRTILNGEIRRFICPRDKDEIETIIESDGRGNRKE